MNAAQTFFKMVFTTLLLTSSIVFIVYTMYLNYSHKDVILKAVEEVIPVKYDSTFTDVRITCYHANPKETDVNPLQTASGFQIRGNNHLSLRVCGISRDLMKQLKFHDSIYLSGVGLPVACQGWFVVEDLGAKWLRKTIDVLIGEKDSQFCVKGKFAVVTKRQ